MALPVTLEEARAQLKVETTDQDDEIARFIQDAAGWVEEYTGLILEAREVTEHFRGFRPVEMRAWPIAPDVVPALAYIDAVGAPASMLGVRLDISRRPARVMPATGAFWPFYDANQLFSITLRAGYENPGDVPHNLRRAMLVLIAAYDADREGGAVLVQAAASAASLCRPFRVIRI